MEIAQTEDELFSVTVSIDGGLPLTLAKEVTKMKAMKVVAEEKRFLSFYHEDIAPRKYEIIPEEVKYAEAEEVPVVEVREHVRIPRKPVKSGTLAPTKAMFER